MISRVQRLTMFVGVLATSACGGGDGAPLDCSMTDLSTLDPNQTVVSLSQEQLVELCDGAACFFGGYGARVSCSGDDIPVTVARSRAKCVAGFPKDPLCAATVQNYIDCMQALRANPCETTIFLEPACHEVTDIYCVTVTANASSVGMLSGLGDGAD